MEYKTIKIDIQVYNELKSTADDENVSINTVLRKTFDFPVAQKKPVLARKPVGRPVKYDLDVIAIGETKVFEWDTQSSWIAIENNKKKLYEKGKRFKIRARAWKSQDQRGQTTVTRLK